MSDKAGSLFQNSTNYFCPDTTEAIMDRQKHQSGIKSKITALTGHQEHPQTGSPADDYLSLMMTCSLMWGRKNWNGMFTEPDHQALQRSFCKALCKEADSEEDKIKDGRITFRNELCWGMSCWEQREMKRAGGLYIMCGTPTTLWG